MGKKNQKLKEKASLARKAIANGTQNSKNKKVGIAPTNHIDIIT